MVENVSMSRRDISGCVEGLGIVGRKRSRGEFVPQSERAGFIAEGCLMGGQHMFSVTKRSEQGLHEVSREVFWRLLESLCQISLLQNAKKPQCSAAFSVTVTLLIPCSSV